MKKSNAEDLPEDRLPEVKCSACNGTGFPKVKQPVERDRKIYPPPCKECGGKGRLLAMAAK
jgi:DnaJ-class molecular chaperone